MSLLELDHAAVRKAFDRAADSYDAHAVLQHEIESRLLERLEFVRDEPGLILDVGCGTGIASAELAARYEKAAVVSIDWAPSMLGKLQQRQTTAFPVCGDFHALPLADSSADVLFSNLAIQWSDDLQDVFLGFRRVLKPGGMLLFSCFGPDTLHELRNSWASADDRPHVNRFPDMHDVGDMLVAAGFSEPVMDTDRLTLEYRDVRTLMHDLKAIGAHNAAADRSTGLTGRRKFQRVLEAYEAYRSGDIYPATYEVTYGLAFGPQEGQPFRSGDGGEWAAFSVEALLASRNKDRS